jgi:CheY-like chemotaxis protein
VPRYWYYSARQLGGPVAAEKLKELPGFKRETLVLAEGGAPSDWKQAGQVPELAELLPAPLPELPSLSPRASAPEPKREPAPDPRLSLLEGVVGTLSEQLAALQAGSGGPDHGGEIRALQHGLAALGESLSALTGELHARPEPLPPQDEEARDLVRALSRELKSVDQKLDAVAGRVTTNEGKLASLAAGLQSALAQIKAAAMARPEPQPQPKPAAAALIALVPERAPAPLPGGRKLVVLSADDDEDYRGMVSRLFRAAGHEVDVAQDGEEALTQAKAKRYDLIVLDVAMPKRNGYMVAEAICGGESAEGRPKVILLTARDIEREWGQFELCGADAILSKMGNIARVVEKGLQLTGAAG